MPPFFTLFVYGTEFLASLVKIQSKFMDNRELESDASSLRLIARESFAFRGLKKIIVYSRLGLL